MSKEIDDVQHRCMSDLNSRARQRFAIAASELGTSQPAEAPTTEDERGKQPRSPAAVDLPREGKLPSLGGATAWLNSPPLSAADLRGKVVLIDFWTYTCIDWLRSLPYMRTWAERYRDHGAVVIGVHSPEFLFERDIDNVRKPRKT